MVAREDELPLIDEALAAASQRRGMKTAPRAVKIDPITDAGHWSYYATKGGHRARHTFECKSITATAWLRKEAQLRYDHDGEAYRVATEPRKVFPKLST